jgi:DNA-binding transcriptional ArsR family regulator
VTGPVLLSAIGFKAELVREPAMRVGASKIYGIATKHPKVAATRKALEEWSETAGIPMEVVTVRNAFDFVEWYYTWMTAQLAFAGKEIVINLTAGHAVASSTAAMIAAQKSLPCVCYDDIEDEVHHLNPSILLKLHELIPRDKEALAVLAKGPTAVGEVAAALDDRMSTISRSLSRLREWGFAHSTPDSQDSRRQIYELRPGVKEFLATILE